MRGTVAAIERHLCADGFVQRYSMPKAGNAVDGLPPGEGAFLMCSFWLADNYSLAGRHDEASALFDRLLALRNDLGLLSEEYDTEAGRLVGNFPQAFSHVSLVTSALSLKASAGPAQRRSAAMSGVAMKATPDSSASAGVSSCSACRGWSSGAHAPTTGRASVLVAGFWGFARSRRGIDAVLPDGWTAGPGRSPTACTRQRRGSRGGLPAVAQGGLRRRPAGLRLPGPRSHGGRPGAAITRNPGRYR